ncbi:MAG TPA: kelch repeat-containing protein, partial [Thermoanaerobaculia bacterium]|nr:kelch repeat-containing protein [Thermoanaerobaculia bacterium]
MKALMNVHFSTLTRPAICIFLALLSFPLSAQPTARSNAGMVYHQPSDSLILFGGITGPDSGGARYGLNDMWEWTGSRWVRIYPANVPSPRAAFAMVEDTLRNRIVLYGGVTSGELLDETWYYENRAWTRLDVSGPGARQLPAAAYDRVRDRIVLFGGLATGGTRLRDTWEFDGMVWTRIEESGPDL